MKAAVIEKFGDIPQFKDFPDPVVTNDDISIEVKAVVLENFDKLTSGGTHYASKHMFPTFPAIVGHSGVGLLANGSLVAFGGVEPPYGTMAEKAVVSARYKTYLTPVPDGVDPLVAAALPASALTSFFPLKWSAKLQKDETVLINGATGVSGKLAIQVAKLLGAGRIIASGRDDSGLQKIKQLGADAVIDLKQTDEQIKQAFTQHAGKGYDVVLDFLWGHPTELLLKTLVPKQVGFATHTTRFVQIGQSAGANITLPAETLRTSGLELMGVGKISPEVIPATLQQIWDWLAENKLTIDIEKILLKDISAAWQKKTQGKRIVIVP
ncbi:MAG TPA: zinc-binding alcohol dehydrogenase family protein [Puia sp.]|jgi:NADPH:quinone reductase-like Zn-dependent oxidoreductase|nr:zinc-binding alcohol dehydrogenase family protein [Puia sp.]